MIKKILLSKKNALTTENLFLCFGNSNYAFIDNIDKFEDMYEEDKNEIQKMFLYSTVSDESFWMKAKTATFVFLTFLRLDFKNCNKMAKEINKFYKNDEAFIYRSLDGYDFAIASFSLNKFNLSRNMEIINDLGISVIETNTLIMTNMNVIKTIDSIEIMDKTIDRASFRFRLKNQDLFSDIKHVISELGEQAYCIRNGNYDIEWIIDDLKIYDLFMLFRYGPFSVNAENNLYQAIEEYEIRLYQKENLKEIFRCENDEPYFDSKYDLNRVSRNIEFFVGETNDLKKVIQFIDSSIQNQYYNDSLLITYNPIKLYLEKVQKLDVHKENYLEFSTSYTNFSDALTDIMEIFNNSRLHPVRGLSFQGDRISIPIKLLTFYSSFIYLMKEALVLMDEKARECRYSFLLIPTKKDNLKLNLILKGNNVNERLILASGPLNAFYKPRGMIFQLTHEVSHYACHELRMRKQRANLLWNALNDYLINVLLLDLAFDVNFKTSIVKVMNQIKSETKKVDGDNYLYSIELIANFREIIRKFLENSDEIFKKLFDEEISLIIEKDDNEYFVEANTIKNKYNKVKKNLNVFVQNGSFKIFIQHLFNITSECFSDLVAIKLLNVSFENYFNNIMAINNKQAKSEDEISQFITVRIALLKLVLQNKDVFNKNSKLDENMWDQVEHICEETRENEEKDSFAVIENNYVENYFEFPSTMIYILKYLRQCEKKIDDKIRENQFKKEVIDVQNIYTQIIKDNVEEIFVSIDSFKEKIYNNVKKA